MTWLKQMSKGFAVLSALSVVPAFAEPVIEDITFSSQPGSKFEVRLDFNEPRQQTSTPILLRNPRVLRSISPTPRAVLTKSATLCPMAMLPASWC